MRKIGLNAHRAKLQVMTAITSVCSVKAWAGSLLAVAFKEIREAHPAESQDKGYRAHYSLLSRRLRRQVGAR